MNLFCLAIAVLRLVDNNDYFSHLIRKPWHIGLLSIYHNAFDYAA